MFTNSISALPVAEQGQGLQQALKANVGWRLYPRHVRLWPLRSFDAAPDESRPEAAVAAAAPEHMAISARTFTKHWAHWISTMSPGDLYIPPEASVAFGFSPPAG